ncbi:AAA family ATPase [Allonocardiopsis opalescens]|uniref:Pilus assembly protein CpaE n=1 Tax=Allonocardiopsis opalescens TaxID=1144618 RepID=A0A2T0PVD1_9ACTN|nr:AAA family ATPase [Allonocardiopsis opalescens]PRX95494.1 pilus assembly protein CpaE [Allonocardiopsis opalescens]
MNYRVILGSPTAEIEASLISKFAELGDWEILSTYRSSRDLAEASGRHAQLDVALVHEELGPLPVLDLIRDLSRSFPQLAVILVVNEVLPDTFNGAMEAGARGVLSVDASLEELGTRVTTAAEWSRTLRQHLDAASSNVPVAGRRGSIVALSGAKGGVGTTTVALHLALNAARAGRTVCLVDLDLQTGDVPTYLDVTHRRSSVDLVEGAETISGSMLADTLYVHPSGMHVLLAPHDGERAEDVSARATRLILGALRSRYEVVIVDCGSHLTEAGAMAIELADRIVLLVTPDLPAIRAALRTLEFWGRLEVRNRSDVEALLTRHNKKNEVQPDFVRKLLGIKLLDTKLPAAYRLLEEAANTGKPDRLTDEAMRKALTQLGGELGTLDTPSENDTDEKKPGETGVLGAVGDRGATLVEFAALVPMFVFTAMLGFQLILFGLGGMYASHAAAEGARQAGVTPYSITRITEEAQRRIHPPWNEDDRFQVEFNGDQVQVTIRVPSVLPGVDTPWDVSAQAAVVNERTRY